MASCCTVVWFRRDLRLEDNPALVAATRSGPVIPLFIWTPEEEGQFLPGRVSRWWMKQSLTHLQQSLASLGAPLILRRSKDALSTLLQIAQETGASRVFYNHLYGKFFKTVSPIIQVFFSCGCSFVLIYDHFGASSFTYVRFPAPPLTEHLCITLNPNGRDDLDI